MNASKPIRIGAAGRQRWAGRLAAAAAAGLLALPGAAHPGSLSQLLRMPLEELLRLEITPRGPSPRLRTGALPLPPSHMDRGTA